MDGFDCDISVLHVVEPGSLKPQKSVVVQLSTEFNRFSDCYLDKLYGNEASSDCPNSRDGKHLTDEIDENWRHRTEKNPKIFNATKFRVHSIQSYEEDCNKVLMCLGVTDYKEYLGTNWADNVEELQARGLAIHDNTQSYLSDVLGVGAFLLTIDRYVVFIKRSEFCAEAPCTWDIPGGHAEPKELIGDIPLHQINLSEMKEEHVKAEIFDSILREVTDEVNINRKHLDEPLYMGTARNKTSGGRPSLEFLIRCDLKGDQVKRLYDQGNQLEADESTKIRLISLDEINQLAKDESRKDHELWKNLSPSAKGCLILYWVSHQLLSTS